MDAMEFVKAVNWICRENHQNCQNCPLLGTDRVCVDRILMPSRCADNAELNSELERTVMIVEQWAKKHRTKTRQSEFLKQFPGASVTDGTLDIRPCIIEKSVKCIALEGKDCDDCRRKYWLTEVTNND